MGAHSASRRFNVQIIVEDEALLNVPFTSTFQYAELDEILNVIGAAMRITYTREGAVITFS